MTSPTEDNAYVIVVDDDASIRESLSNLVRSVGMKVKTYASAQEFLARRQPQSPGCLVLDVQLPGLSGLDLQEELAAVDPPIPIVFITGHGDIPMTVRAMKAGAIEFLAKPFRDDDLLNAIEQGMNRVRQLSNRPVGESSLTESEHGRKIAFSDIVGNSATLRHVFNAVATVAPTDSTVLIQGESGTGKELIARAVHELSSRRGRPFLKLNCAAIPTGLLESELFGHEKGAFTSAIASRAGRFELADGGTFFLDEIGDIPLELQPKLLRVLQDQEFERVGGTRTLRTNVRIVAATNRNLVEMVADRHFRNDLYYRLNVFPLTIPPLRERREDIPLLVRHFAEKFGNRMGKRIETIPNDTLAALVEYHWPGNIRELENLMERAVILTRDARLSVPVAELHLNHAQISPSGTLEAVEREHILRSLQDTKWVIGGPNGAATRLGLKRTSLQYRMHRLGISRPLLNTLSNTIRLEDHASSRGHYLNGEAPSEAI